MSLRDLNLNCRRAAELLSEEQDRNLDWSERAGLRIHLCICAGCRFFKRQLNSMREAIRRGDADLDAQLDEAGARLSSDARDRIERALQSESGR